MAASATVSPRHSECSSRPSFEELLRSLAAEHERQLSELRALLGSESSGGGSRSEAAPAPPPALPPPQLPPIVGVASTLSSWAHTAASSLTSAAAATMEPLSVSRKASEASGDSAGRLEKLAILKETSQDVELLPGGVPRDFCEDPTVDRRNSGDRRASLATVDLTSECSATATGTAAAAPAEVDASAERRFAFSGHGLPTPDDKRASNGSIFSVPENEYAEGMDQVRSSDGEGGVLGHSYSMFGNGSSLAQTQLKAPDVKPSRRLSQASSRARMSICSRTESISRAEGDDPRRSQVRRQSIRQSVRQSMQRTLTGRDQEIPVVTVDSSWTELPEIIDPEEAILRKQFTSRPAYSANFKIAALRRKKAASQFHSAAGSLWKFVYMNPTSQRRLLWDLVGIIMITYDLVLLPLSAFPLQDANDSGSDFIAVMGRFTTSYWALDVVSNFICGYQTEKDIEMNPWKIAMHYFKGWFFLDILLVASDIIVSIFIGDGGASFLRFGKSVSRGMRVVRMIRLVKLRRIMADIMDRIPSEYARTLLRVLKLLIFIILLNHYIACGWYWLGSSQQGQTMTWILKESNEDSSVWYFYTTALHWSLTQFTPASMEVVPTNRLERTYSVCVLMFALVTFSSFVSTITSSVTHLQHINARKLHNQVLLRRYLSERRISAGLVLRVCHYSQNYHRLQGGMERKTAEDKVEALKILPSSMRQDIRWEAFSPDILAHPIFFQYNISSPCAMREVCSNALLEVSLAVVQELFSQQRAVKQMLFVLEGNLKYSYPANLWSMEDAYIGKHQWACEIAIWAERADLFGPFVATCCCDVLLLSVQMLQKIARNYPASFLGLACYAERFIEHIQEVSKENRWKTVLCNSFDTVHEMAHLSFDSDLRISRRTSRASVSSVEAAQLTTMCSRLSEETQEQAQWSSADSRAEREKASKETTYAAATPAAATSAGATSAAASTAVLSIVVPSP